MPLPFLLAGPILRRVEPQSVSVWVACSQSFSAKICVWESTGRVSRDTSVPVFRESENRLATQLGDNLFVCLVTLKLTGLTVFTPASLYSYNVIFTKTAGGTENLNTLGLLDDIPDKRLALGYGAGYYPSFVLPPPFLERVRIAHGSCRKPHGYGNDSLVAADYILEKAFDPTKTLDWLLDRPQQLYLTGDQIYADDVAAPLIKYVTPLANELIGKEEMLPLESGQVAVNLTNFPLFCRLEFMQEKAKLTSGEAHNHLISFGEFCASYLMAWSTSSWPDEAMAMTDTATEAVLNALDNIATAGNLSHIPPSFKNKYLKDKDKQKEVEHRKTTYKRQLKSLVSYRKSLPRVMRAMANIPVYMMWDDHEITDDWYLTQSWRQSVLASPSGRAVIRNGMAAYALFQDWGNSPEAYDAPAEVTPPAQPEKKPKYDLRIAISSAFDKTNVVAPANEFPSNKFNGVTDMETILGLINPNAENVAHWHYKVPTGPVHTLVLDTRTRRFFERPMSAPGLINSDGLKVKPTESPALQIPEPDSLPAADLVIVVSPAPVLGLALMERIAQSIKYNAAVQDFEAWCFNDEYFEMLLARLHEYEKVILLSGDVHYAFTMNMDYWKKNPGGSGVTGYETSKIVQLVSSACKNENEMLPSPIFINGRLNQLEAAGMLPASRLGWKQKFAPDKIYTEATGTRQPADITFSNRMRIKKEPVLLSPGPAWDAGTLVEPKVDWAWTFGPLMDVRPEAGRPSKIRMTGTVDDALLTTDAKQFYEKVMELHMQNVKKTVSRRFVWTNNLGVVKFRKRVVAGEPDPIYSVDHELWHYLTGDSESSAPDAYTVYSQDLTLADPTAVPNIS